MREIFSAIVIRLSTPVVCMGLALSGSAAIAQEAKSTAGELVEIVVVAQKRAENLQNVPIAISAFTGDSLAERQIGDVSALGKLSPNVSFDSGSFAGTSSVLSAFIRGIGQTDFAFNFDPGVGVYVDGVYLGRSVGANLNLFDVERIEVLKGPQGTLFGRNTVGGAINVITETPSDKFAFRGEYTAGSFNRHDFRGLIQGPIADTLSGSLTFSSNNRDGYVKRIPFDTSGYYIDSTYFTPRVAASNLEGGVGENAVRGKLKWAPRQDLDIVLSADYTRVLTPNMPFNLLAADGTVPGSLAPLYNACISLPPAVLGAVGLGQICGPRAIIGTALADGNRRLPWGPEFLTGNPDTTYATGNSQENTKAYGGSGIVAWNVTDNATLKSITAYRQVHWQSAADYDGSPIEYLEALNFIDQHQFSQELQLVGKALDSRLNYVFGAYYYDEYAATRDHVTIADLLLIESPSWVDTKASAAFTHLEYELTDQLGVTIGARYTREKKNVYVGERDDNALAYKGAAGAGVPGCFPITPVCQAILGFPDPANPTTYAPAGGASATFTNFSPSLAVNYKFTPDVMGYSSFSKGYKSGGWTTRLTSPVSAVPEFGPEKATAFEVGLKSELFDHRLRANLAAFTTKYESIQVNFQVGVSPTIRNAGDARISGFEGEVTAAVSSNFTVSTSVGYLHARYTRIDPGAIGITLDSRLQKVPEFNASLSPRYQFPLANGAALVFLTDYSYRTRVENDAPNTPTLERKAVSDLGASLAYQADKWKLAIGGSNILNKRYILSGITNFGSVGLINGTYDRPAEWYASIGVSF